MCDKLIFRADERFPAICLIVKHWAINAGINDAMTGTFNRFSFLPTFHEATDFTSDRIFSRDYQAISRREVTFHSYQSNIFSYSLILLVLHYLQCVPSPPVLPNLQMLFPAQFTGQEEPYNLQLFKDFPAPIPGTFFLLFIDERVIYFLSLLWDEWL